MVALKQAFAAILAAAPEDIDGVTLDETEKAALTEIISTETVRSYQTAQAAAAARVLLPIYEMVMEMENIDSFARMIKKQMNET